MYFIQQIFFHYKLLRISLKDIELYLTSSFYAWGLKLLLLWVEVEKPKQLLPIDFTVVTAYTPHQHFAVDPYEYFCELIWVSILLKQPTQIQTTQGDRSGWLVTEQQNWYFKMLVGLLLP